jgi:hypothetical protein
VDSVDTEHSERPANKWTVWIQNIQRDLLIKIKLITSIEQSGLRVTSSRELREC